MDLQNMETLLNNNAYPGRGIVIGMSKDGQNAVFAYFIMGRSENSRNRVFRREGSDIMIYPYDESKVSDPSLIIYAPVRDMGDKIIVTNGDQTDTIRNHLLLGKSFESAQAERCFEPDAPNFTPRISGLIELNGASFTYKLGILKAADEKGSACNRYVFNYEPLCGIGHFIHTYEHDGSPLPTFKGEPGRIQIPDSMDEFANLIWDSLNADNKISLYVRYVNINTKECSDILINKHTEM
ncbi:MAG: IMP cyclohydrolase [Clostridia bacterium]|nr:IMP cyclohydrolase [Clostridia bacterium]